MAARAGATVLALTDTLAAPFEPAPSHLIRVSRGEAGAPQSLIVPMSVANAVILDLANIDDGRSLKALDAHRSFRQSLPEPWQ